MKSISRETFRTSSIQRLYSSKNDDTYFKKRLQELKEQNTTNKDDPLYRLTQTKERDSLVDQEEALEDLYSRLSQSSFNKTYIKEIHYAKTRDGINRQAKEIALSRPWRGEEHLHDAALRMLVDTVGKAKRGQSAAGTNLAFINARKENAMPRSLRSSRHLRRKLENAQDNVQNYKLDKEKEIEGREQSEFRALYTEKFTPIGSFEKIHSVADQRIEEARRKGSFDGLEQVRGKPLVLPSLNQQVDRTEYYLNNMLARQKVVPPWIEAQARVNHDINGMRHELLIQFEREILAYLKKLQILADNEDVTRVCFFLEEKFGSTDEFILKQLSTWKLSSLSSNTIKIKTLNNNLRTYNLQAPLSAQKLYLKLEQEYQRAYTAIDLPALVAKGLQDRSKEMHAQDEARNTKSFFPLTHLFQYWK